MDVLYMINFQTNYNLLLQFPCETVMSSRATKRILSEPLVALNLSDSVRAEKRYKYITNYN